MQALLTVIVAWLSVNFNMAATEDLPRVEFASPAIMAEVRGLSVSSLSAGAEQPQDVGNEVYAIYDDAHRTIYLPTGWTGATPSEVSLLVHETVHHLQNVAGISFDCAAAREKLAYSAQARWLQLFGTTLEAEFGIDEMTVLVRTNCFQ
jgi:hypothetical protein